MFCCITRQDSVDGPEPVRRRPRKKLVVVGDGGCGKTCLLHRFVRDDFDGDHYTPTLFETARTTVNFHQQEMELILGDTTGQAEYELLRPMSYPNTDVVLICFSVDEPYSLENVCQKLAPEIRHFFGDIPVILVGTKTDLRTDFTDKTPTKFTSRSQGEEMAARIRAVDYMECSSRLKDGVEEVFQRALTEAFRKRPNRRKSSLSALLFKSRDINYSRFV